MIRQELPANRLDWYGTGVMQSPCTISTPPCWAQYNTGWHHEFTLLWLLSASLMCSLQILLACTAEPETAPDLFALGCFVKTAPKNPAERLKNNSSRLFLPSG